MGLGFLAPALGAIGGAGVGQLFGGGSAGSVIGQSIGQNFFNAQQASEMMDFQRDMSNTAVQRRMADLAAAGINPVLAGFGSGGGASSPGGAAASSTGADITSARQQDRLLGWKTEEAKYDSQTAAEEFKLAATNAADAEAMRKARVQASAAKDRGGSYTLYDAEAEAELARLRNDRSFELESGSAARYMSRILAPGLSSASSAVRALTPLRDEPRVNPRGFRGLR